MNPATLNVQSALNLILPIAPGHLQDLIGLLKANDALGSRNPIHVALTNLRNVHFAHFAFLENGTRLAVLTIYDGDFDAYITSFVHHVGDVFNQILKHIDGGPEVSPVQAKRDAFLDFIRKHDRPTLGGVFSAYPNTRVFDILDAMEQRT
jgi:hypothetical protein